MTNPERDPKRDAVTGQDMLDEPDFAGEHDKPTFADEHAGRPGMEPDESTPSNRADTGGFDPQTSTS
jgi:hypothetical protein